MNDLLWEKDSDGRTSSGRIELFVEAEQFWDAASDKTRRQTLCSLSLINKMIIWYSHL